MPTPPNSPASEENQPSPTADHSTWRLHVPALASAAAGIVRVSDAWDAVSNSFHNHDDRSLDRKGLLSGVRKRNAEAWTHVEVFLDHGPEALAGVRAAASGADYVEGPISEDLRRLRGIDTTLERAGRIRHEWDQVMALMDASLPGSRELYASRAQEIRNSEGWHQAAELAYQGPALVRAAEHLASRAVPDHSSQERAQVALARSSFGHRGTPPVPPPTPPASNPAATRRSR
ncbi:hypothetical protein [Streptomyces zagrosensis]|uniref:Uncharacterized protein n=1 Tax=Streptomyces zagrosensis TaxID=1042984 RepID=A0A7W9V3J3_9ACTN|nr:hypothetical protein [Streptomyces zagrosensis]MBB5939959.1 hypothetical protein [Streptomyces zagrosensis]